MRFNIFVVVWVENHLRFPISTISCYRIHWKKYLRNSWREYIAILSLHLHRHVCDLFQGRVENVLNIHFFLSLVYLVEPIHLTEIFKTRREHPGVLGASARHCIERSLLIREISSLLCDVNSRNTKCADWFLIRSR